MLAQSVVKINAVVQKSLAKKFSLSDLKGFFSQKKHFVLVLCIANFNKNLK